MLSQAMSGVRLAPLWPAGHRPHGVGGWQLRCPVPVSNRSLFSAKLKDGVISLLVGGMPGKAEGGENKCPASR